MRQVMLVVRSYTGEAVYHTAVMLLLVGALCYCLGRIIALCPSGIQRVLLLTLISMGFGFTFLITVPEEKIHILEFGLLGWCLSRDMLKEGRHRNAIITAVSACLFFGIMDELLQGMLPYRTGDLKDILFNIMGSLWGISVYIMYTAHEF